MPELPQEPIALLPGKPPDLAGGLPSEEGNALQQHSRYSYAYQAIDSQRFKLIDSTFIVVRDDE